MVVMSELHEAASNGDLLSLESGLKEGIDPNEPDTNWGGRTPLHIAAMTGHNKILYVLLQYKANPNSVTDTGWTPAHFACEGGHTQCLQTLINSITTTAPLTALDANGQSPCDIATVYNHMECVKLIEEKLKQNSSNLLTTIEEKDNH